MGLVGNRVRLTPARPPRDLVERFLEASPPDLADAMNKSGAMRDIAPAYLPIARCVGPALTVKIPTGSSMMILKAMELAQPGDVIVIDGRGALTASLWGGNRSLFAAQKKVAGVVIDGAMRDVAETRELNLPLFARAICPMAGTTAGPGEINYPVACGGVVVAPGDIVVADAEGIAVVPLADAEDVHRAWRKIVDRERAWRTDSASGRQVGGLDVDRLLRDAGTEVVP
ncbi:MAG TPA: RraA family protein [bacterium]|nr:RraA family protein [bacterium]